MQATERPDVARAQPSPAHESMNLAPCAREFRRFWGQVPNGPLQAGVIARENQVCIPRFDNRLGRVSQVLLDELDHLSGGFVAREP